MNIIEVLTGCGNNEYVITDNWEYKGDKLCIFLCLDDYEELMGYDDKDLYTLKEGEKPIKASAYIVLDPSEIDDSLFDDMDMPIGDESVLSELYTEYGAFIKLPLNKEEFEDIDEGLEYFRSDKNRQYIDVIMRNTGFYAEIPIDTEDPKFTGLVLMEELKNGIRH